MRPAYKSPAADILLVESDDNDILPVIEYTTIGQEQSIYSVIVDEQETLNQKFDEKDYDFYGDEKTLNFCDEKVFYYDEEKMELIKKEEYFDDENCKFEKAYKDEKNEEDQWVLPSSEVMPLTRSKFWNKSRILTTMAALYTVSLVASYLYFYQGSACM